MVQFAASPSHDAQQYARRCRRVASSSLLALSGLTLSAAAVVGVTSSAYSSRFVQRRETLHPGRSTSCRRPRDFKLVPCASCSATTLSRCRRLPGIRTLPDCRMVPTIVGAFSFDAPPRARAHLPRHRHHSTHLCPTRLPAGTAHAFARASSSSARGRCGGAVRVLGMKICSYDRGSVRTEAVGLGEEYCGWAILVQGMTWRQGGLVSSEYGVLPHRSPIPTSLRCVPSSLPQYERSASRCSMMGMPAWGAISLPSVRLDTHQRCGAGGAGRDLCRKRPVLVPGGGVSEGYADERGASVWAGLGGGPLVMLPRLEEQPSPSLDCWNLVPSMTVGPCDGSDISGWESVLHKAG
ncbi:hypothetical protein C8R45DRAFT_1096770 [Mycena sanguinolenta]|nr:hypothetical protein C8R45DRAFT_1096770 [Mycena sanguinolenta]